LKVVAFVLSAWTALRWLGFLLGLTRVPLFAGPQRREARRTVINRGAINVFLSVLAVYLWAIALGLQLTEVFVGFLAAATMCSLAVGIASTFMQPEERTPETIGICRLGWPGGPPVRRR
jgi:hypothetical protein